MAHRVGKHGHHRQSRIHSWFTGLEGHTESSDSGGVTCSWEDIAADYENNGYHTPSSRGDKSTKYPAYFSHKDTQLKSAFYYLFPTFTTHAVGGSPFCFMLRQSYHCMLCNRRCGAKASRDTKDEQATSRSETSPLGHIKIFTNPKGQPTTFRRRHLEEPTSSGGSAWLALDLVRGERYGRTLRMTSVQHCSRNCTRKSNTSLLLASHPCSTC